MERNLSGWGDNCFSAFSRPGETTELALDGFISQGGGKRPKYGVQTLNDHLATSLPNEGKIKGRGSGGILTEHMGTTLQSFMGGNRRVECRGGCWEIYSAWTQRKETRGKAKTSLFRASRSKREGL